MSTIYDTREVALEYGLYSIGFKDTELRKGKLVELLGSTPSIKELGWPQANPDTGKGKEVEIYDVNSPDGEKFQIGTGVFRDGFDSWVFNTETGCGCRVNACDL